jgi:hypothetical protein
VLSQFLAVQTSSSLLPSVRPRSPKCTAFSRLAVPRCLSWVSVVPSQHVLPSLFHKAQLFHSCREFYILLWHHFVFLL